MTGRLSGQPRGRVQGPAGEYIPIRGAVRQNHLFPGCGKDHGVVTDDIPRPHHRKADVALAPQPRALVR